MGWLRGIFPSLETEKVPANGTFVMGPCAPSKRVKRDASSEPDDSVVRALSSEMFPIAANPESMALPELSTIELVAIGPSVFVTVRLAPSAETDINARMGIVLLFIVGVVWGGI